MNKIISLALVSSALLLPTASMAAGDINNNNYTNRGQCESALATATNDLRKAIKDSVPPPDVNAYIHEHYSCQQNADGSWSYVFS